MAALVRQVTVIRTLTTVRGKGTPESPNRRVEQYWSLDGKLLAEMDPHTWGERPDLQPGEFGWEPEGE